MFQFLGFSPSRRSMVDPHSNRCRRIPPERRFHIIGGEIMEIARYLGSRPNWEQPLRRDEWHGREPT
jgi:hypothetical protein